MSWTRTNILASAVMAAGIIVSIQYAQARAELNTAKHEYVYHICLAAHNAVSGQSEQDCGNAQDRTDTEFICNDNGTKCFVKNK